jgi:3-oxoadipyl-CoA thiolase
MTHAAVVVAAVRSPFGRYGGALAPLRIDDLAAAVLSAVVTQAKIEPAEIDDVILGCANQAGEDSRDIARVSSLLAGFPVEVPGQTVNRLCGSGMQAVVSAAREIECGGAQVMVAGGVEGMSRAAWVMSKPESLPPRRPPALADSALGWRFPNPRFESRYGLTSLGKTAENVADRHGVTREDQDAFALRSHQLAVAARESGVFAPELVSITVPGRKDAVAEVSVDEGPRADTDGEALARLQPAFAVHGTVTAGNSSPLNDGAAALVLMSESEAARRGAEPLARFVDAAVAGVDPDYMGIGPVPATEKLLSRPGAPARSELDLIELNEAFASQALACVRELGLDPDLVNVNGGAIAIGHPLGASGARLVSALVHELGRRDGRFGLASMCIGVGQGISSLWEKL